MWLIGNEEGWPWVIKVNKCTQVHKISKKLIEFALGGNMWKQGWNMSSQYGNKPGQHENMSHQTGKSHIMLRTCQLKLAICHDKLETGKS